VSLNVGILGGGNISQTHMRAALEVPGVRVVAVCGYNDEKTARLAGLAGAAGYQDLDAFLSHRPMDAVLIGSPSGLHAQHGIASAKQGIHVLVEKPIDISTNRADALIAACEQAHVKLGVFFQDRVATDIRKLKTLIDAGKLGKPILISASVKWYRPPEYYSGSRWRGTWSLDGGGALMNQGIHTVDLMLFLFGEVSSCWGRTITALHEIEVEDTVVASFEFENGAIGNLDVATSAYPGLSRRIEIIFTQGTVVLENDGIRAANLRTPIDGLCEEQREREDQRAASPVVSDTRGHRAIIEDFIQSIATDGVPLCDGYEARRSVRLVSAIYESSRTGKAVPMRSSKMLAESS
jgi:UDP-N-acetyl-2-amino-2-deoxyglucuronate dehydrogenase